MDKPLVSIVIPTYSRKEMCLRLLKSIFISTYKKIEVIVIDDASPDNTKEFIQNKYSKKPNLKIFKNKENLFTAGSRNEGQARAKGELILFIDDDNVIDKYMIEEMVKVFVKNNSVGEVGPINYSFKNKKKIFWTGTYRNMFTTKTYHLIKFPTGKTEWETSDVPNAFMVRTSIVKKNKIKFVEKYGIMYEESDYAYKIRKAGYKIMVSKKAKIYHDIESSSKKEKVKDYMYHFMTDKRRPFVFARNRVIFHSEYSNKLQLFSILFFWVWFFSLYYIYKILFYSGVGNFSFKKRLMLSVGYLRGTFVGVLSTFQ